MPTILIFGAASGIGKAFLNAYASTPENHVVAIDREPIETSTLPRNITTKTADITNPAAVCAQLEPLLGTPIDLVIHCVGVRGLVPSVEQENPSNVAAAETLNVMDEATMAHTYAVNAIGTFTVLKSVLPLLLHHHHHENADTSSTGRRTPPRVVVMGSRMGSMGYNTTGAAYAYRASKAALNAIVKSFSIDVPDVVFTVVHPGRVESGLVRCREEGAISAEESVARMVPLIEGLTREMSGTFVDRFGVRIEW
ncbi:hypothetical protein FKW77_009001 [Venturia effusa]|uniref:NAD(P)-binding protein n=1 Tax=Venturia effusa TaxID=50376 RepID=A0A517L055_9PEZI|nr:hypothetical protein FKW77_009001 [Venturia effusa]